MMALLKEIRTLTLDHTMMYMAATLAIVSSGHLWVYQFKPSLVVELGVTGTLAFSTILTGPLILLNTFISFLHGERDEGGKVSALEAFSFGCVMTAHVIYGYVLYAYLNDWTFKYFLGCLSGFEIAALLGSLMVFSVKVVLRKRKNKHR